MKERNPALILVGFPLDASEVVPTLVVVVEFAAWSGGPDHLRHRIGELPETLATFLETLIRVLPRERPLQDLLLQFATRRFESFLHGFAVGNVSRDPKKTRDLGVRFPQGRDGELDGIALAVLWDVGPLALVDLASPRPRDKRLESWLNRISQFLGK